jgi:hypothetical protein
MSWGFALELGYVLLMLHKIWPQHTKLTVAIRAVIASQMLW